jgi:hypothetical protein
MIKVKNSKLHWNYFLAIEQDMERTTRYIEFCDANLQIFSIELAHLLFAAASEVDVLAKCICEIIKPKAIRRNMNMDDYRRVFNDAAKLPLRDAGHIPNLAKTEVFIPRYGIRLTPWDNWAKEANPNWWRSYNHVKHERNRYFQEATLQNALNALGALLVMNYYYQFIQLPLVSVPSNRIPPYRPWKNPSMRRSTTQKLTPESTLFRLPEVYYDSMNRQLAEFAMGFNS